MDPGMGRGTKEAVAVARRRWQRRSAWIAPWERLPRSAGQPQSG